MKNILAFDCSSNDLAIYLKKDNEEYFNIRKVGLRHSEKLLPLIDSLLKEAGLNPSDLDLVACAKGPGSFTGLRIAMATAKGIANAAEIPLVSVLTPDYLVANAPNEYISLPVIDAKKKRYYSRMYYEGKPLSDPLDIAPDDLAQLLSKKGKDNITVFITGPDAPMAFRELEEAKQRLQFSFKMILDPFYHASRIDALAKLALEQYHTVGADSETSGPLYIRRSEAEEAMNLDLAGKNSPLIFQD